METFKAGAPGIIAKRVYCNRVLNWLVIVPAVTAFTYVANDYSKDADIARVAEHASPITLAGTVTLSWSKNPVMTISTLGKAYRIRCDTMESAGRCLNIAKFPDYRKIQVFGYNGSLIVLAAQDKNGVAKADREDRMKSLRSYAQSVSSNSRRHSFLELGVLFGIAAAACRHMMLNEASKRRKNKAAQLTTI